MILIVIEDDNPDHHQEFKLNNLIYMARIFLYYFVNRFQLQLPSPAIYDPEQFILLSHPAPLHRPTVLDFCLVFAGTPPPNYCLLCEDEQQFKRNWLSKRLTPNHPSVAFTYINPSLPHLSLYQVKIVLKFFGDIEVFQFGQHHTQILNHRPASWTISPVFGENWIKVINKGIPSVSKFRQYFANYINYHNYFSTVLLE